MDLLSVTLKIWRHRLVTFPIIVLTLAAATYVVAIKKPEYQAKTSFALLYPPPPPTADQLARDPELAKIDTNNPYTRFSDQSVIISILASTMNSRAAQQSLSKTGAQYVVGPSMEFGYATPVVQVTANAWNPMTAVRTATTAGRALSQELNRMQAARGVAERYRIRTLEIGTPGQARLQASGKLRTFVGVVVMGAIALFVALSVADAFATLRVQRRWSDPLVPMDDGSDGSAAVLPDPYELTPESEMAASNGHHTIDASDRPRAAAVDDGGGWLSR
jgi:hypothetical protein